MCTYSLRTGGRCGVPIPLGRGEGGVVSLYTWEERGGSINLRSPVTRKIGTGDEAK